MKKRLIGFLFGMILTIALVGAVFFPEPWGANVDADGYNLSNVNWVSADVLNGTSIQGTFTGEVTGNMNWTKLQNYPVACPGSGAITLLNDSVTCSDLWLDVAGDTMTGNLDISGANITVSGRVGIGTTNPTSKLHVVGDGNFTQTITIGTSAASVNITMFSPDGSSFTCGVLNTGAWACS